MPAPGTYDLRRISREDFVSCLKKYDFQSFIGYEDTAKFLERISGVKIPVSREPTTVESGDALLIVKLKYRLSNPGDKAKFTPLDSDYEFFECYYTA